MNIESVLFIKQWNTDFDIENRKAVQTCGKSEKAPSSCRMYYGQICLHTLTVRFMRCHLIIHLQFARGKRTMKYPRTWPISIWIWTLWILPFECMHFSVWYEDGKQSTQVKKRRRNVVLALSSPSIYKLVTADWFLKLFIRFVVAVLRVRLSITLSYSIASDMNHSIGVQTLQQVFFPFK